MILPRRNSPSRAAPRPNLLLGTCLSLLLLLAAAAQAAAPGQAALATAHPLATEAGLEILAAEGNAFDAAVAISAALAVVEPYGSGIGGGGFFLLREAGPVPDYHFLDARERAPLAATSSLYERDGQVRRELSLNGPLAAGIPGLPAAWVALAESRGQLPLSRSLAPAIRLALNGFAVDALYRERARWRLDALRDDPESARLFLLEGDLPPEGHRLRQPELAETLERLAQQGHAGFYEGALATRLVAGIREQGGIWTLEDLAAYRVVERPPLLFPLAGGQNLIGAPPPSAGGIVLAQSLGLLERLGWQQAAPVQRAHLVIESLRRAYRDRVLLGDPDHVEVPVSKLVAAPYLDSLAAGIDRNNATPSHRLPPAPAFREGEQTTHFTVLDTQGNAVAATQSLNFMFGAAFTIPGTGVLLNNEMDDFAADPHGQNAYRLQGSYVNTIAPGKRPLSSMSPTFIEGDQTFASFGSPGGSRIPSMVLLAVLAHLEGQPPQQWAAARRYHHQYRPDVVELEEEAFSPAEQAALAERGHRLAPMQRAYGNMQVIFWDKREGKVEAASDPRGIGTAVMANAKNAGGD